MKRFRDKNSSCPICGGYDNDSRGKGRRCHGFLSDDERYAHCTREEFAGSLTINAESATFAHLLEGLCACGTIHGDSNGDTGFPALSGVVEYPYCDEHGEVLYEVVRYEPKTFRMRKANDSGGWTWSMQGVQRVLYRLPELLTDLKDEPVCIVEGEKDCDRLRSHGLAAPRVLTFEDAHAVMDALPEPYRWSFAALS